MSLRLFVHKQKLQSAGIVKSQTQNVLGPSGLFY